MRSAAPPTSETPRGDREAACLAGIPFVWAAYGFGRPEAWDARVETFSQLEQLF